MWPVCKSLDCSFSLCTLQHPAVERPQQILELWPFRHRFEACKRPKHESAISFLYASAAKSHTTIVHRHSLFSAFAMQPPSILQITTDSRVLRVNFSLCAFFQRARTQLMFVQCEHIPVESIPFLIALIIIASKSCRTVRNNTKCL